MLRTILTKTSIPISFSISWLAAVDCWVANKLSKVWAIAMFARIKAKPPRDCESEESEAWAEVSFAICKRGKRWLSGGRAGLRVETILFFEIKNFFIKISPTLTMMVSLWRRRSKGVLARPLRHVARLVLVSNLRHSNRGQGEVMWKVRFLINLQAYLEACQDQWRLQRKEGYYTLW